jgi:hypothetical protein
MACSRDGAMASEDLFRGRGDSQRHRPCRTPEGSLILGCISDRDCMQWAAFRLGVQKRPGWRLQLPPELRKGSGRQRGGLPGHPGSEPEPLAIQRHSRPAFARTKASLASLVKPTWQLRSRNSAVDGKISHPERVRASPRRWVRCGKQHPELDGHELRGRQSSA